MLKRILYTLLVLITLILVYLSYDFIRFKNTQQDLAIIKGKLTSKELKQKVNTSLVEVMTQGEELRGMLEKRAFSKDSLEGLIEERANLLSEILGITVAYEPYAFNEETKLYAPYYDKHQHKLMQIGTLYDYTDASLETSSWYVGVYDKGAHWVEPYYAQGAQALVADYSIPFNYYSGTKKGKQRGVVTMTISLKGFTEMIHSLSLGKTGFGFVSSKKGALLAHPVSEYVGLKDINDLIKEESCEEINSAYSAILKGETGFVDFYDNENRQQTLFFYDNVPAANWNIAVLFFKNELLKNEAEYKRIYINISLAISVLFIILLALFYSRDYLSVSEIWYLSLFTTTILLGNIFLVGYLEHTKTGTDAVSESPPITNITSLNSIVNKEQLKAKKSNLPPLRTVPTGIYIERLDFKNSYDVDISGVIWLKYANEFVDKITQGFRFPQTAPFAEASFVEEKYKVPNEKYVLVGYDFRTTLHLNFDYSNYPFDKRNINLEIQPVKATDNILLVPDLKSYSFTNPFQKSGLSSKIKLSGSKILESYYSYSFFNYNTNFGYPNTATYGETPILHYNINVREVLITAFVTYLIPIFVTLIMMFIVLYSTQRAKKGKIDGGTIVQGMTAFFFVLVFSHIDLRKNIETADLIYMEYFYFITYMMIIFTTYNLITFSRVPHKLFDYKDNLIVKAAFWPLFLLFVLVITLAKFY